jgi:hypothetical protein
MMPTTLMKTTMVKMAKAMTMTMRMFRSPT